MCNAIGLEIHEVDTIVSKISGNHADKRSNNEVNGLIIKGQNTSYIANDVGKFFPQLTRYEVRSSNLIAIKRENFKDLNKIEYLVLEKNSLETLPSDVFADLTNLKHVRLSGNKLTGIHFETFANNDKVEIITLDNNNLVSIHEKLLTKLNELKEIYLQNNKIEELREETFSSNSNLRKIEFSNNRLKWIGEKSLSQLSNLKSYSFSNNDCIIGSYKSVDELTAIFLDKCYPPYMKRFKDEIEDLKKSQTETKGSLENCETSKLEIEKDLETANELKSSAENDLDECKEARDNFEAKFDECDTTKTTFESENKELIENLTRCESKEQGAVDRFEFINKTLHQTAEDNKKCNSELETLTKSIKTKFEFDEYKERKIDTLKGDISKLENDKSFVSMKLEEALKTIKAHEEKIAKLMQEVQACGTNGSRNDEKMLELLQKIDNLTASNSKLIHENQEVVRNKFDLTKCQEDYEKLYQSSNPLCNMFVIGCTFQPSSNDGYTCKAKHVVACQPGMKLSSIEGTHSYNKAIDQVQTLEISDSIFQLTNDIFRHLPYLRKLKVKNSGLSSLEPRLESANLLWLEIDGNKLNEIPNDVFVNLDNLEDLHLDNNVIKTLNVDSFSGLSNLVDLSLSYNEIFELPDRVFDELINLRHLSLKRNFLISLSGNLFKQNVLLESVQFDENLGLKSIGSSLLDHSERLTLANFKGTCVSASRYDNIQEVKKSIKNNCFVSKVIDF